ncbi:MAG: glycosyltransferase WbuB [Methylococcaceae bacterium]
MKILLYGINYAPELTGIGKYSGEMCEWLTKNGHDVRVICAPPYYPEWQVGKNYKNWLYKTEQLNNVTLFRCPLFVPKKPTILTRLVHLLSFSLSSFPVLFRQWLWKPDIVICIQPTLFCVPATVLFCKLRGSKSLLHIQDFELDAMLGLGLYKAGVAARIFGYIERWLMRRFDAISTISYSMVQKAKYKTRQPEKIFYFPNWVDTNFLTPNADQTLFRKRWDISKSTRVILYSGNIGKKQGLEIILQAADQLREEPDLLFLLIGTGAAQEALVRQAEQMQLPNLRFYPLQSYNDLPALMALADIHLVVQKKGAADSFLPSKLTTILAVGGECVITTEAHTELGLLCQEHPGIARCIEPENANILTETLREMLLNLPLKAPGIYNKVAHQFALSHLKKDPILNRLASLLAQVSGQVAEPLGACKTDEII